jgi:ring-1,2-phenylacetyl-CoA epoxidase subunit PaaC
MQASIQLRPSAGRAAAVPADVQYLLRLGDTCLILAQRLGEWCGHAPILEEDIALTNMALDLVGQARAVLTRAGELAAQAGQASAQGLAFDEDQLAFLRDERDYFNLTLVELPRGDFATTVLRNAMVSGWLVLLWQRLQSSADAELAAIAAKALKEARYHQEHAADWVLRLGDGTELSRRRMQAALDQLWPYCTEMLAADAVDAAASASGLGPAWSELRSDWQALMQGLLQAATLELPEPTRFVPEGKQGRHSEHMGHLLAQMQHLQRAYPGGVW